MLIRKLLLLNLFFSVFGLGLLAQEPKKEVNILLLGKSSAGKSSLINMFYNHLNGKSYRDNRDIIVPYVHGGKGYEVNIDDYKFHGLKPGTDSKSQTKGVYWYKMDTKDLVITFWDTPGIPDTEGPAADKKHLEKIKDKLATVEIHAIAIVLPPGAFDRESSEYLTTTNNIVNNLPKSYSENIIGIVTRVDGNNLDDDTKADYRKKLSTAFTAGGSNRQLSEYFIDGSSFFNKTSRGPANWASDGLVVAQIIERVRKNKAAPREDVVELQHLMKYLEGNVTSLDRNIADHLEVKQKLHDAQLQLPHEERRRDANKNYQRQRKIEVNERFERDRQSPFGSKWYGVSKEECTTPMRRSCGSGTYSTCAWEKSRSGQTFLERGLCRRLTDESIENYEDETQRNEYNAAVLEVTKQENVIKANKDKPEDLKKERTGLLNFIVGLQTRRNELALTTDMSVTIKSLEDKMKEISEGSLSEEEKKKELTPRKFLKKIYTQMANEVLNLGIDSDL